MEIETTFKINLEIKTTKVECACCGSVKDLVIVEWLHEDQILCSICFESAVKELNKE